MGTSDQGSWQTAEAVFTFNDTIRDVTGAGLQYWAAVVLVLALVVGVQ